jgi:hypothetical protein
MQKCTSKAKPEIQTVKGTSIKGRDGSDIYYMATDELYPMKTPYLDYSYGIHEGMDNVESPSVEDIKTETPFSSVTIDPKDDLDIVLPRAGTCHKMCPDVTCPKPVCPQPVCPKIDYTWIQANFIALMILLIIIVLILVINRRRL